MINQFVIGYKYDRKKYHKCTVSFGKDYSLQYDLCVQSSQYLLDKFVSQKIKQKAEEVERQRQILANQVKRQNKNKASSVTSKQSQKDSDNRMDHSRKIARKPLDSSRTLKRSNDFNKVTDSITIQDDSEKDKFNRTYKGSSEKDQKTQRSGRLIRKNSGNRSLKSSRIGDESETEAERVVKKLQLMIKEQQNKKDLESKQRNLDKQIIDKRKAQEQKNRNNDQLGKKLANDQKRATELKTQKQQQQQRLKQLDQQKQINAQLKRQEAIKKRQQIQIKKAEEESKKRIQAQKKVQSDAELKKKRIVKPIHLIESKQIRLIKQQLYEQPQNLELSLTNILKDFRQRRPHTQRNTPFTANQKKDPEVKRDLSNKSNRQKPFNESESVLFNQKSQFKLNLLPIPKSQWKKPLVLRKTDSIMYDHKGKVIIPPMDLKKQKKQEKDMKWKIILVICILIGMIVFMSSISSSKKRRH